MRPNDLLRELARAVPTTVHVQPTELVATLERLTEHVLDEHMERLGELFGERLADALHVGEMFRRQTGFILLDIHPGNIAFADEKK